MNPNQITITLTPGCTFTGTPRTAWHIREKMKGLDVMRPVRETPRDKITLEACAILGAIMGAKK